ncbi:MAG: hypothetical protein AAB213_00775 [Candidatus Omnitrophota bacterium]
MSKIYSKLNQINTQRLRERNILLDNQGKVPITGRGTMDQSADQKRQQKNGNGILLGSFAVFAVLLLILNISAYSTIRNLTSGDIATARKLASIEAILEKNSRKLDSLSEELKASAYKAKIAHEQMAELEEKADGQSFVINNLVKAKDQLLSRVAKLEQTNP